MSARPFSDALGAFQAQPKPLPSVMDVAGEMALLAAQARAGLPRRALNLQGCGAHCADRYGSTCGECDATAEAFAEEVDARAEELTEDHDALLAHIFCDLRADLAEPIARAVAAVTGHPAAAQLRAVLADALKGAARAAVESEWAGRAEP